LVMALSMASVLLLGQSCLRRARPTGGCVYTRHARALLRHRAR
jgi:hypothetical protein